jgi:hypothetical protein
MDGFLPPVQVNNRNAPAKRLSYITLQAMLHAPHPPNAYSGRP